MAISDLPKYVTFDENKDQLGCLPLTHDKDYKVIGVHNGGYLIEDDLSVRVYYHKSFFYPEPTKEELLHQEVDSEDEGFENLEFIWDRKTVCYLDFDKLSKEQIDFCYKYFKENHLWDDYGDTDPYHKSFVLDENGLVWGNIFASDESDPTRTFNDLFVYKDEI